MKSNLSYKVLLYILERLTYKIIHFWGTEKIESLLRHAEKFKYKNKYLYEYYYYFDRQLKRYRLNILLQQTVTKPNQFFKCGDLHVYKVITIEDFIQQKRIKKKKSYDIQLRSKSHDKHFSGIISRTRKINEFTTLLHDIHIADNFRLYYKDIFFQSSPYDDPFEEHQVGIGHIHYIDTLNKTILVTRNKMAINNLANKKVFYLLLSSKASSNYFHFLFEDLIKLKDVEDLLKKEKNITVLVSSNMPKQHYQILTLLFQANIMLIDPDQEYFIKNLYCISAPYIMHESYKIPDLDRFMVSKSHVLYMQKRILGALLNIITVLQDYTPRRIFIVRKKRSISNFSQIKNILKKYKFDLIDPSYLSFEDQVKIFYNAEVVMGASGSGLSNILFCKPHTKIISIHNNYNINNCLFSTLADILGLEYHMLIGSSALQNDSFRVFVGGYKECIFSDIKLDCMEFESNLKRILAE